MSGHVGSLRAMPMAHAHCGLRYGGKKIVIRIFGLGTAGLSGQAEIRFPIEAPNPGLLYDFVIFLCCASIHTGAARGFPVQRLL
jgi:hypothetical protein